MRIGVVSDIHCDHEALAAALADFDGAVDEIWCAGDIVLQYRFCNRTTRLLRDAGVKAIQGNHDMVLVSAEGVGAREADGVDPREVAWLAGLPREHRVEKQGCRLLMTHGSPWAPHGDYLSARNDRWQRADDLGVDILVSGHTHEPMVATFGHTLVVNPGSLGEPRQRDRRCGTYAILDTDARDATIGHIRT
ncbi:MAG TPA: metallophosphoesterase family protein [Acidimicrobiales bacterium]|nr:metallophosphoesterase family protein [Acidimicrobiales bacterium]